MQPPVQSALLFSSPRRRGLSAVNGDKRMKVRNELVRTLSYFHIQFFFYLEIEIQKFRKTSCNRIEMSARAEK